MINEYLNIRLTLWFALVALLCRRTAKSGGTSKVVSSIAMRNAMQEQRPDLMPALQGDD